ncbi:MAG: hypothetical protein WD971_05905 [Pirellulales bacterium]
MRIELLSCALVLVALVGGCRLMSEEAIVAGHSPLRPARPSPDSVQLEVIWARCPLNDSEINDTVWSEIDETHVAPAVQRELARNGFRVGVIAGTPPDAIARVLNMDSAEPHSANDGASAAQSLDLVHETKIHGSRRNLRRGERMEIRASENMASMPLLVSRGRDLGGREYRDAQAIYALTIDPQADQTVKVELTPEIHYGPSQLRWSGGEDGMDVVLRQLPMREREVFESMRMEVRLAPGEILMLAGLPDSGSRPGHYFHTAESSGGREQKIVLIRLAQVPRSDTFAQTAGF